MAYSLADEKEIIVSCIKTKKPILERDAFRNPNSNKKFVSMINANEFVCVPLVVKDEAIGVICADNVYSRKPTHRHQWITDLMRNICRHVSYNRKPL